MNEINVDEILGDQKNEPESLPPSQDMQTAAEGEEASQEEVDVEEAEEEVIPTPSIEIEISPDKLYAYLTITQEPPEPYQVTVDQLYDALAEAKVEYGVMLDKLDLIVANQQYPTHELIAVGKGMVPGVDAELEYLFSTEVGGRPTDMGLYVDHRDLKLVENVTAGQVLIRKIPAQAGEDGMSVYGQPLRAPRAKDVRLPAGKGTKVSDENPLELIAERDGFVRLDKSSFDRVVVEEIFQVKGDVDLSTGNLNIEGSVRIMGNVRDGFEVKATGNIQILKSVEAANVEAGGSIEISRGIIGGVRGATVKAAENIKVKFADHATIAAGQNITVAEEAINCTMQADLSITAGEQNKKSAGAIIGGFAAAGQEIKAVTVGTDAGILTRLRVGQYSAITERRRKMQTEIKGQEKKLEELKEVINSLNKRQSERLQTQKTRAQQQARFEQQLNDLQQRIKSRLAQAEQAGLITSLATLESLEEEIKETRATLVRVESSIETLRKRLELKTSVADSLKTKKTLEQFDAARENLVNKLTDMENIHAQRAANPWGNLPWTERRELEQLQASQRDLQGQLAAIEAENATDQKIEQALTQLYTEYQTVQDQMEIQKEQLTELKRQIEELNKKPPQIIVSGKLWGGTEVIINDRRRRFTKDREAVRLQLSENDAIIVLSLV